MLIKGESMIDNFNFQGLSPDFDDYGFRKGFRGIDKENTDVILAQDEYKNTKMITWKRSDGRYSVGIYDGFKCLVEFDLGYKKWYEKRA